MHLLEPGDEIVLMTPNYMQAPGLANALGAKVTAWPLACQQRRHALGTGPCRTPDAGDRTNENHLHLQSEQSRPDHVSRRAELDEVCAVARRSGAWLVSDEIYRGAEMDGVATPTAWGRYERVIVTSGLSKAYGLPGLRIGWLAAPPDVADTLWGVHDYTTIAPGAVSDVLARIALSPGWTRTAARAHPGHHPGKLSDRETLPAGATRSFRARAAGGRGDRVRPLSARDQFLGTRHPAPGRAECARRARRSLPDGSSPANRIRLPSRTPGRCARTHCRTDGSDPRRCALISR